MDSLSQIGWKTKNSFTSKQENQFYRGEFLMANKTSIQAALNTISIPKLRSEFKGHVIAPDDPDYNQARTVFYGGVDRHPAVIIKVADVNDVVRVVNLAREIGLELAIRS